MTIEQINHLAANNKASAENDGSGENHSVKHWQGTLGDSSILSSGDVAVFNQAMRRRFYVDPASGRLYTPGRK